MGSTSFHITIDVAVHASSKLRNDKIAELVEEKLRSQFEFSEETNGLGIVFKANSVAVPDTEEFPTSSKNGQYVVGVECDLSNGSNSAVARVRSGRLLALHLQKQQCNSEYVSDVIAQTIAGLFRDEQTEFSSKSIVTETKTESFDDMREVKFSPEFKVSISLLNADPDSLAVSWDAKKALDSFLKPFLETVSDLAHFEAVSQVLQYSSLPIQPHSRFISELNSTEYLLSPNVLPMFINSAEWNLASDLSVAPSLNFVIYIPPKAVSPLYLLRTNGAEKLDTNAFLIPRWGGIAIVNPDRSEESVHFGLQKLKPIMEVFIAQLRGLLGIKEMRILAPKSSEVVSSINHIESAITELRQDGNANLAAKHARLAISAAESAFFDPTMVSLLYFPDEHKYAVYMPLFTPIAVPLIIALIKEIKRLKKKKKVVRLEKTMIPIPHLSYSTVEQILAINTHIIKILIEYQNNGWFEEQEYKIYQQRLQTNLTYLATAADLLGKPGKPEISKLAHLKPPPDMGPVVYPQKLLAKASASASASTLQPALVPEPQNNFPTSSMQGAHHIDQRTVAEAYAKAWPANNVNADPSNPNLQQQPPHTLGQQPNQQQIPINPAAFALAQHQVINDENPNEMEPADYNPVPPFSMPAQISQEHLPPNLNIPFLHPQQ
ncbi:hypothetical protein HDU97_002528 [Phlyctochytrium planicorne]|nr:hypothetical protein HDU97_002528 [Phlyctochytrium planicorne]